MTALLMEANGTIKLPKKSLKRYGFAKTTPVRLIETNEGILLVPLHNAPMSEDLKKEIAEWQEATSGNLEEFPYERE